MLANNAITSRVYEYHAFLKRFSLFNDGTNLVTWKFQEQEFLNGISTALKYLVDNQQMRMADVGVIFKVVNSRETNGRIEDILTAGTISGYKVGSKRAAKIDYTNLAGLMYHHYLVFKPTKEADLLCLLELLGEFTTEVLFLPDYVL